MLDGDIYLFRAAAASEEEDFEVAVARLDSSIRTTLDILQPDDYKFYISGSDNFRYKLNPDYKANRIKPDPRWREDLKKYCLEFWNAEMPYGIEADDALGIEQIKMGFDSIICSIDKDMAMIPGWHYNQVKDVKSFMEEEQSNVFFWKQLLTGDRADNIFGIHRCGPVTAAKIVDGKTEDEIFEIVRDMYNDDERMLMNARCLWIHRKENDDWLESKYGKILNTRLGLKPLWPNDLPNSE